MAEISDFQWVAEKLHAEAMKILYRGIGVTDLVCTSTSCRFEVNGVRVRILRPEEPIQAVTDEEAQEGLKALFG